MSLEHKISSITIIGIGEVGSHLTGLLLSLMRDTEFNLIDNGEDIDGRVLDLKHAAVFNNNRVFVNDYKKSSNSEVLFFTAGRNSQKGASRNSVLQNNRVTVQEVFDLIKPKPGTLIIVITNPVEPICHSILAKAASCKIIGTGTLLDTLRLTSILSKKLGDQTSLISANVIGEHGEGMIPLLSKVRFGDQLNPVQLGSAEIQSISDELITSAEKIRKTEKATKFGVSQCAVGIMRQYFSSESSANIPISILSPPELMESLNLEQPIFISWPSKIGNQKVTPQTNLILSRNEEKRLIALAKQMYNTQH